MRVLAFQDLGVSIHRPNSSHHPSS